MKKMDSNQYIDGETLSKKLDDVIFNESKILRMNLKNTKKSNINTLNPYV